MAAAAMAVSFLVACGGGDPTESDEYQTAIGERDALADERESLEGRVAELDDLNTDLEGQVDDLRAEVGTLESERDQIDDERQIAIDERDGMVDERDAAAEDRDRAVVERDAAVAAAEELRALYDPQIQAQIAAVQAAALDAACAAGDVAGFDGTAPPVAGSIIAQAASGLPDVERQAAIDQVDENAVSARIAECRSGGEARRAAAALTQPHGDGLWTVGLEIAAGLWRSTGTGDDCYWKRSPDGAPDDIIDNHFGIAGGTVTLNEGEEFQTERCGSWEYVS